MPVYNCEDYLNKSIGSVLEQTLKEWELLCIDDGSQDNSLEILREHQKRDDRIKIYTQENKGAGEARNLGLRNAVGEYIAFLDADDCYLDADALECMYMACKVNNVKSCGTNLRIMRNGVIVEDIIFKDVQYVAANSRVLNYSDFQFDYGYYCFIIERKLIEENNIIFPPYCRFEDPQFFVRAMYVVQQFCFIDKALYCYRAPNTATRVNQEKLEGLLCGIIDNLQFAQEHGLSMLFDKTVKRLEDEYGQIICHNLSRQNTKILQLLCKANDIIQQEKGEDYVIKPLGTILSSVSTLEEYQRNIFSHKLQDKDRIYIYGAGKLALDFVEYLKRKNLFFKVAGVLVSDTNVNPKQIDNVMVSDVDSYCYRDGDVIVIAVSGIYQDEIIRRLEELKVLSYERLDIGIFDEE